MRRNVVLFVILFSIFVASIVALVKVHDRQQRSVSVKGLSEKIVESDQGVMDITIKNYGTKLEEIQKKRARDKSKIIDFLKKNGVQDSEIDDSVSTVDQDYSSNTDDRSREGWIAYARQIQNEKPENEETKKKRIFIVSDVIRVKLADCQKIKRLSTDIMSLLSEDIFLSVDYKYILTNFSNSRLDMLNEASSNALQSAKKFMEPQDVEVGKLISISQGSLNIKPADAIGDSDNNDWNDSYKSEKSFRKKLRLVVSAKYEI